jgi:hypothetical protein
MGIIRFLFLVCLLAACLHHGVIAQNGGSSAADHYIDTYKDMAIEEMRKYRIPASIKLAQGILESASGNSNLAQKANNHFGIKCHLQWRGKTFRMDDDKRNECFRKYRSVEDSFRDHSLFLTTRDRYASLFDLELTDYYGWAYGLKAAGYATNPRYPELLVKIIEENKLYIYDRVDLDDKQLSRLERKGAENGDPSIDASGGVIKGKAPLLANLSPVYYSTSDRPVYENNGVPFIFAKEGDTQRSLADEFDIYAWQIRKYNELKKKSKLKAGEVVYLERKRSRASKKYKEHVVSSGESMVYLSQLYGIKLKKLYHMNGLSKGMQPAPGERIRLR